VGQLLTNPGDPGQGSWAEEERWWHVGNLINVCNCKLPNLVSPALQLSALDRTTVQRRCQGVEKLGETFTLDD
jgi:hypothetical protein